MAAKRFTLFRDALFNTVLTFIAASLLYLTFVNLSFLDPFEKAFKDFEFTDVFYAERFNSEQRNRKIILVNIKHVDRFQLAEAIDKIAKENPKVIGVDAIFKDRKIEFSDSLLKSQLLQYDNIVTAYYYDQDSIVDNHSYFDLKNNNKGYINLNTEGQNTVIRNFVGVKGLGTNRYAFATKLALKAGYIDTDYANKYLTEPLPINYIGGNSAFLSIDIAEILNEERFPVLKDAIVIMGYLGNENPEFDIEDKHFTPLNEAWIGRAAPDTFGAVIHANIVNMLTKKKLIKKVPKLSVYAISFFCCFFIVLFSMRLHKRNSFVFDLTKKLVQLVFSIIVLYLALLLLQNNIYLNVLPIILLALLGVEMIDFYEHLVIYLNKKYKWKSQFL